MCGGTIFTWKYALLMVWLSLYFLLGGVMSSLLHTDNSNNSLSTPRYLRGRVLLEEVTKTRTNIDFSRPQTTAVARSSGPEFLLRPNRVETHMHRNQMQPRNLNNLEQRVVRRSNKFPPLPKQQEVQNGEEHIIATFEPKESPKEMSKELSKELPKPAVPAARTAVTSPKVTIKLQQKPSSTVVVQPRNKETIIKAIKTNKVKNSAVIQKDKSQPREDTNRKHFLSVSIPVQQTVANELKQWSIPDLTKTSGKAIKSFLDDLPETCPFIALDLELKHERQRRRRQLQSTEEVLLTAVNNLNSSSNSSNHSFLVVNSNIQTKNRVNVMKKNNDSEFCPPVMLTMLNYTNSACQRRFDMTWTRQSYVDTRFNQHDPFIFAGGYGTIAIAQMGRSKTSMDFRVPEDEPLPSGPGSIVVVQIIYSESLLLLKKLLDAYYNEPQSVVAKALRPVERVTIILDHGNSGFPSALHAEDFAKKQAEDPNYIARQASDLLPLLPKNWRFFTENFDDYSGQLKHIAGPAPLGLSAGSWVTDQLKSLCAIVAKVAPPLAKPPAPSKWILAYFSLRTNPAERTVAMNNMYRLRNDTTSSVVGSDAASMISIGGDSYSKTIEHMVDHRFVLTPFGHAFDSHRILEALLLGRVPIVRFAPFVCAYEGLPVLRVRRWADITWPMLEEAWAKFGQMKVDDFDLRRAFMPYWKERMINWKLDDINKFGPIPTKGNNSDSSKKVSVM